MHRGGIILLILAALGIGGAALLYERSGDADSTAASSAPADAGEDEAAEEEEREGEEGRAENELLEEQEVTQERLEALEEAVAQGRFGQAAAPAADPAPGWRGSRLMNAGTDDWEPTVAADPRQPYVYLLTTRFTAPPGCSSQCPLPHMALAVSADGGASWGAQRAICVCRGSKSQFDPTIEVVPNTGAVYSVFLNGDRAGGFS